MMTLLIYCAGGFGKEICDIARRVNASDKRWEEILFVDDNLDIGNERYGARLITFKHVLERFELEKCEAVIANGEPSVREAIYQNLTSSHIKIATLIDTTAIISDTAILGEGVIVTPYCSISSSARVGNNVALNTKAIVGHDVKLGDHTVVSSLVNIGGACSIGRGSYIGMGAMIKEGLAIGSEVIIGMGSVVYQDIPDTMIALGNPARPARLNVDKRVFRRRE